MAPHSFPPSPTQFPQNPGPGSQQQISCEDFGRLGLSNTNSASQQPNHREQQQQNIQFRSIQSQIKPDRLLNLSASGNLKYNYPNGLDRNRQFDHRASPVPNPISFQHRNLDNPREYDLRLGKQHYVSTPPPGLSNKARGGGNSRRGFERNVDAGNRFSSSSVEDVRVMRGGNGAGLTRQLDHPGPPSGANLALDSEESLVDLHREARERHWGAGEEEGEWSWV